MVAVRIGSTYRVHGCVVRVVRHDTVQGAHVVESADGRTSYVDFSRTRRVERVATTLAKRRPCQLYLMKLGPRTYKAGCTSNLPQRLKAARTWSTGVKVVATKTIDGETWSERERHMLQQLRDHGVQGGGKEVFHLPTPEAVEHAKRALRRS